MESYKGKQIGVVKEASEMHSYFDLFHSHIPMKLGKWFVFLKRSFIPYDSQNK